MPVDRSSPEKVVVSYCAARFAVEKAWHEADGKELVPSTSVRGAEVNAEHCTAPHPAGGLSWPPGYDLKISSVKKASEDRYEVEARRDEEPKYLSKHFRFVVDRKSDGWRISAEYSIDDDGVVYEFWRDVDPRLSQLYDEHLGALFDKQDRLAEVVGNVDWNYQTSTGMLSFGEHFSWHTQIIGSESESKFTWRWGWANPKSNLPERSTEWARKFKAYGEQHKLIDLTTEFFPLGLLGGWRFMTIATGLFQGAAAYRAPQDDNLKVFLVIDDPMFPTLPPKEVNDVGRRIARIFNQAAQEADDEPRALAAYLRYYGLQSEEKKSDGTLTMRGLRDGRAIVEATFDEKKRLTKIVERN